MTRDDHTYATPAEREEAIQAANALSRRNELIANVKRNHAMRDPRGQNAFKSAVKDAIREEIESAKAAAEAGQGTAPIDKSGTAPTYSDSQGNFAPNPDVANVGGTGVAASNTKAGTVEQAQNPDEVDLSGVKQGVGPNGEIGGGDAVEIPADWEGSPWQTRVALAKRISGRDEVKTDEANDLIRAELSKRS